MGKSTKNAGGNMCALQPHTGHGLLHMLPLQAVVGDAGAHQHDVLHDAQALLPRAVRGLTPPPVTAPHNKRFLRH